MADIDIFMHAERIQESGDNYKAYNASSGAAGAYQFTSGTWVYALGLAGVKHKAYYNESANRVPPRVQDDAARALMLHYYNMFQHSWHAVAEAWYGGPGAVGHPNYGGGPGYPTVGEYADDVMRIYHRLGGHPGAGKTVLHPPKPKPTRGGIVGAIEGLYHSAVGDIRYVRTWVLNLFRAVYEYINIHVTRIWHSIAQDYRIARSLFDRAWHYIRTVYLFAKHIVNVTIRDIVKFFDNLYHDVLNYAKSVYRTLLSFIDWVHGALAKLWNDIVKWVLRNIWDPLKNLIDGAWHWITHEGYLVYYYITHPDKLAALLGHWLWISWIGLLKANGRPIARWLLHQMLSLQSDFLTILEDVISAML